MEIHLHVSILIGGRAPLCLWCQTQGFYWRTNQRIFLSVVCFMELKDINAGKEVPAISKLFQILVLGSQAVCQSQIWTTFWCVTVPQG